MREGEERRGESGSSEKAPVLEAEARGEWRGGRGVDVEGPGRL